MSIENCGLQSNCHNSYQCWICDDWKIYQPIDKRILSPAQIEKKLAKKAAKKEQKNSEASKRGKQAKRTGKYAEKGLDKLFNKWGLPYKDTVMSGQLKTYAKTFGKTEENRQKFEGDKWVEILSKWRMIESKKRLYKTFKTHYKRCGYIETDKGLHLEQIKTLVIGDSFVMLSQTAMWELLFDKPPIEEHLKDQGFTTIKKYFAQDNSDIVTLCSKYGARYADYIFCLTTDFYKELKGD